MNKKEMMYDYLKFRYRLYYIASTLDVPILILLWWLGYKTGFWVCVVLMVLSAIAINEILEPYKVELGLKKDI